MNDVEAVLLVEGVGDQVALDTLAERHGRNLEYEGVSIVPMGGASGLGEFLNHLQGPEGFRVRVSGLCDEGEVSDFQRGLERAGLGSNLSRFDMESLGFYVCVVDLEDELIRSLGVYSVERVIEDQGNSGRSRRFRTSRRGGDAPSMSSFGAS